MGEDTKKLEEIRQAIQEQREQERKEALKDFHNFEERYSEFLDENREGIKNSLSNAYSNYVYSLKQDVSSSNYAIAIAFPLFVVFAIAIAFSSKYDNATTRAICAIAFGAFPLYATIIASKLRDKIVFVLFLKYERSKVIERYVRNKEELMLNKLMSNESFPGLLLCDKYASIKYFYGRCLKELKKEDFTFSYYEEK